MIDADYCGSLHSYLAGVTVDDNALALDAFKEVGPGNHFFGCAHTMANYETAFWDTTSSDNDPFEKWELNGSVDTATRANRAWKRTLDEYVAPPLDPAVDEQLLAFITARKDSMADAWY